MTKMECQKEETEILKRTKRVMINARHGVKLIKKRSNQQLKYLLGLEEALDRLPTATKRDVMDMFRAG